MPTNARLPERILAAREHLARARDEIQAQHARGQSGAEVCSRLTDLFDKVVLDLYQEALVEAEAGGEPSEITLVAHGGYGRRDVAPFSDLDLMLLTSSSAEPVASAIARPLARDIFDAGLHLGFSLRTLADTYSMAMEDATVFTSLAESRFLTGDLRLFHRFMTRFRRQARKNWRTLVPALVDARYAERHRYGETVYLLEPNIKRSRGGLRDIQMVRWLGFARYGRSELENLCRLGVLTEMDRDRLFRSRDFLLRMRNEMHFHSGKTQDSLARSEQVRLAEVFAYVGQPGILPAEHFMRDYFDHTEDVRYVSAHFLASVRAPGGWKAAVAPVVGRQIDDDFRIGPVHIRATRKGRAKVCSDLAEVLRLMDLANVHNKWIDHSTWEAIRNAMAERDDEPLSREAARRFLSLMSQPGRLADLLRRLHQLRALEKIIPAMQHVRCLVEFTDYHKFTVDEHSIRAVECATEFLHDPRPIGDAYRGLRDNRLMHLALLIHDLGKGYTEDHCDVGAMIATVTANRLNLSKNETESLKFLVAKHLLLPHTALRQDLNDPTVSVRLAVEVGSPEILQMLFILACADLAAVGPGVLTAWKLDLLTDLYVRTRRHLTGEEGSFNIQEEERRAQHAVQALVEPQPPDGWWKDQIRTFPSAYLNTMPAEQIFLVLNQLRHLSADEAAAWANYVPEQKVTTYLVGAHERKRPVAFHQLAGTLTGKGLQILSAEIHTLGGRLVLDRFFVEDMDFTDQPPPERLNEVCDALVASLTVDAEKTPAFRRLWQTESGVGAANFAQLPTRIRFDDSTSDKYTIITIFAYDRRGLLYSIAHTLFQLGLVVCAAKIATHLDQVVDVFYVTNAQGRKIYDEAFLAEIRKQLTEAIQPSEDTR